MVWTVLEEQLNDKNIKKHAGGKAREDLHSIFLSCGFSELIIAGPEEWRDKSSKIKKLYYHFSVARLWNKLALEVKNGDSLVVQFPVINHTLFLNQSIRRLKRRGVRIYAFIHDLEIIRMSNDTRLSMAQRWRMKREELDELNEFDKIVVHNNSMKEYLANNLGIDKSKMVVLDIFDYLATSDFHPNKEINDWKSCIIAGNLNSKKSGYIYKLPQKPSFELYGVNFEGNKNENINYHGAFLADELPFHMKGGFGLVWDGDSAETCSGAWGEYLKYNNPHKTSLYLACGIPVIIWKEAALADFILENKVGLTVSSLAEVDNAVKSLSDKEFSKMKENAIELSEKIRRGYYTKAALNKMGIM